MMWLRLLSLACLVVVVLHLQMADADDRQAGRVRTRAPWTGQSGGAKNSVQKKRKPPIRPVPGNKSAGARLALPTRTTTTTRGPTTLKVIALPTRATTVPVTIPPPPPVCTDTCTGMMSDGTTSAVCCDQFDCEVMRTGIYTCV